MEVSGIIFNLKVFYLLNRDTGRLCWVRIGAGLSVSWASEETESEELPGRRTVTLGQMAWVLRKERWEKKTCRQRILELD